MTQPTRNVDLSIDPSALGIIIDNLIISIAGKIEKGDPATTEKNMLFQIFLADLRSQQVAEAEAEKATEEDKETKE